MYATMKRIADSEPRALDTWAIGISAGDSTVLAARPVSVLPARPEFLTDGVSRAGTHKAVYIIADSCSSSFV